MRTGQHLLVFGSKKHLKPFIFHTVAILQSSSYLSEAFANFFSGVFFVDLKKYFVCWIVSKCC